MRLGTLILAACALALPVVAAAQTQTYSGRNTAPMETVIRPAANVGWRNYVTVPDGPCGYPMAVEADCYNNCRPCGPLHPICFLHRVGRMLDCLLPCNMCCRGGGGCGLFHGCLLGGGRTWGHCGICCGGAGGCGGCGACGGCCPNPCGSAFAPMPSCTTGGHCFGCTSTVPTLTDPFQDDPLPPTPTAQSATEVRRAPVKRQTPQTAQAKVAQPKVAQARAVPATPSRTSPYKIIKDPTASSYAARPSNRQGPTNANAEGSHSRKAPGQSVLRRASAEHENHDEPARFEFDRSGAAPIIRSQSPDDADDYPIPHNPLRR
jgi:hypothetical protein